MKTYTIKPAVPSVRLELNGTHYDAFALRDVPYDDLARIQAIPAEIQGLSTAEAHEKLRELVRLVAPTVPDDALRGLTMRQLDECIALVMGVDGG